MANTKDIKDRIKSISNTSKITSTMEMVSTAKMKKLQTRLLQSKPYNSKIGEILANLVNTGVTLEDSPLFRKADNPGKILVVHITGNRGLCGSFNINVINTTLAFKEKKEAQGADVQLYVIGKKSTQYFNFTEEPMFKQMVNPDDRLTFEDTVALAEELTELFINEDFDEIYVSYTAVETTASQKPKIALFLPISPLDETDGEDGEKDRQVHDDKYIFEPGPEEIMSYLLPLYIKMRLFNFFLESAYSEHFARRVAMKNATDASKDMLKGLKLTYNRARQAKITTEIAEIVGGAAALE